MSDNENSWLRNSLTKHEGWKNKPYTDSEGKLTIGVGFNLTDVGLFDEEINFILDNRIRMARGAAEHIPVYDSLNAARQGVLVEMVYNMGLEQVLRFSKTLKLLEMKEWVLASEEMLDSNWADQVGKRATDLAKVIKDGRT